ncbi:Protein CASC5, partial [Leptosomus discolor]
MDNIYADPNMEIDSTEHFRGKRLSSILKAPRNALDDLGSGNELTQDINIKKHRKISRRVSFANTIRVFQQDLKSNTAESTGMNTLLHGPIQALVQQTEWHDADNATQRTNRHDTTLIFSDENEMDVTASHTAVITRDLESNEADKTEKIDITWFLAQLNSNNGKAQTSKEFQFFSDPTDHSCLSFEQKEDATAVKKINFSEFLMSLKSNEKACDPIEGPEKENVLFVPSPVSEDVAQSLVEFVYSHEPPDTCNATQVFRGQDGGMEMTKCQASEVRAVFSGTWSVSSETVFRGDKTVVFAKHADMEITGSYTDVTYNDSTKERDSSHHCQNSDRQDKTRALTAVNKVLPTRVDSERDFSVGRTVSSEEGFQKPRSVGGLHLGGAEEPLLANTSELRKGSSQLPLSLEKSVVFPSGENMDLTGNCGAVIPGNTISVALSEGKAVPGYLVQGGNKTMFLTKGAMVTIDTISAVPADKTIVFAHSQDDMEITASHTIAVNNNANGFENQE